MAIRVEEKILTYKEKTNESCALYHKHKAYFDYDRLSWQSLIICVAEVYFTIFSSDREMGGKKLLNKTRITKLALQ